MVFFWNIGKSDNIKIEPNLLYKTSDAFLKMSEQIIVKTSSLWVENWVCLGILRIFDGIDIDIDNESWQKIDSY